MSAYALLSSMSSISIDLGVPPLRIENMVESSPLKSRCTVLCVFCRTGRADIGQHDMQHKVVALVTLSVMRLWFKSWCHVRSWYVMIDV